jgi:hypothetical protein
MKKSLRKPANWPDFEDLCKKLFGEIWKCNYTIKKNGRQGDKQFGVDVYAIPKDETEYWGIQCKGKDEYAHKQLTETEIEKEISKAETFKPKLKTFIFASTANKNSTIEEYIRLKDIEYRKSGGFGIILYCWEDLVDLIEENRSVFNWYVNGQQFKETHKVWVGFENDQEEYVFNMPVVNHIKRCNYVEYNPYLNPSLVVIPKYSIFDYATQFRSPFSGPDKINKSWCKLNLHIKNIGEKVVEDWKLFLYIEKEKYKQIDDDSPKGMDRLLHGEWYKFQTCWVHDEDGYFTYKPLNNNPLIQKDSKSFEIFILPNLDIIEIKLTWEILSRDYSDEGELILKINHEITENIEVIEVNSIEDIKEASELKYFYEKVERKADDFMMPSIIGKSRKKK